MRRTKKISWDQYCPQMRPPKSFQEFIIEQVNKEAEVLFSKVTNEIPADIKYPPSNLKKEFDPGWFNFFRYNVKSFAMAFLP